jgi:hypothetical protein
MIRQQLSQCHLPKAAALLALLLLSSLALFAQTQTSLTGKYEGVIKDETGQQKLTLDLVDDSGKYSGTLTTGKGSFKILKGQMANGTLTLEIEKPGGSSAPMSFKKSAEGLTATFAEAGKNITVDFRKTVADEISGQWDATADANGQPFPFTLILKVDGEKVTGTSNSELGLSNISTGTWKDGKLVFVLESANGQIGMVATIVDGKLVGDFDLSGQLTGKWAAIKKKP